MMFPAANNALAELAARKSMESNQAQVIVLTTEDFISILQDKAKQNPSVDANLRKVLANSELGKYWNSTVYKNVNDEAWLVPTSQAATDALLISKTVSALGLAGLSSYVKAGPSGQTVIILKGYAANRNALLQGTRFLASHSRMMHMGLGMKGAANVAKGGFVLGLVVSIGIESLDFMFNDQKTMFDLVGGIGVEAVKGGLAVAVGLLLAKGITAMVGVAIAPLLVVAVVVGVAGFYLNWLDNTYGVKAAVIAALKEAPANVNARANNAARQFDIEFKNWIGYRLR